MKQLLSALFLLMACRSQAQLKIVPRPAEAKLMPGYCTIKEPVGFIAYDFDDKDNNDGVEAFKKYLRKEYKITQFKDGDTHSYGLPTEFLYNTYDHTHKPGYYEIEVTGNQIYIRGSALGSFYAYETIKQLITRNKKGELVIPHCVIKDYPRFAYRGMHLDVSRHFFTVPEVKKYIDYLTAYKFNNFHWHLTDDQGWRIEIKKYPLLTKTGGCRAQTLIGNYGSDKYDSTKYCGYYTQQQIREVVKYAADRHINIVPEIEMPGHALAALSSYPYLGCTKGPYKPMETWGVSNDVFCAGNDNTYKFFENVLSEVMQLFPSKYIHIGGDECPKDKWKTCPVCQQRMKSEGLQNEHELQSYFIRRIEKYVNKKGRKIIGWDEILEGGLAPDATVMSWNGEEGGIAAAKQKHDVIMTPQGYCYFDRSQSANEDSIVFGGYTPLEKVYNYDPVPAGLTAKEAKHILGAQGNMWTEYITNKRKLEYMLFPRIAALAEVLWSPASKRDWKDFEKRLPVIFDGLKKRGINYSTAYYDPKPSVVSLPDHKIGWKAETKNKDASVSYREPGSNEMLPYTGPVVITQSGKYEISVKGKTANEDKLLSQLFFVNKATGKKIVLAENPSGNYPGDGAFTLVNGVQNNAGMARSSEFLGFNGKNAEAVIDLGEEMEITGARIHTFTQRESWIYPPSEITVLSGSDGINFTTAGSEKKVQQTEKNIHTEIRFTPGQNIYKIRYVKIIIENYGIIPEGSPGSGNPAWLFVDEIELF